MKLPEGNVFTPVCDSVHKGEVSVQTEGDVCSRGYLSGRPPYGNVRTVRILLECIIVLVVRTKQASPCRYKYSTPCLQNFECAKTWNIQD